jgi:hypothetical protein
MVVATEFNPIVISNPCWSAMSATDPVAVAASTFENLPMGDRLAILWTVYRWVEPTITSARSASRLVLVEGLLNQIQQMSCPHQMAALLDLVTCADTPVSRAYGLLNMGTKWVFWSSLIERLSFGCVATALEQYKFTKAGHEALMELDQLQPEQQIVFWSRAIAHLGVDPFA